MRISARGVALILEKQAGGSAEAFKRASIVAAGRIRADLVRKTPVDQGIMKNAWQVMSNGMGVENMAPHAGIIEGGARPHAVNADGIQALTEWAIRKGYASDEKEAAPIVWGIVKRLKEEGSKGLFIARDLMPKAAEYLGAAYVEQLAATAQGVK